MKYRPIPSFLIASILALPAWAFAQVQVSDAWVRATVAQQKATGAFMQLESPKPTRLVSVQTSLTATAELHEMALDNDVMRMREVNGIDLPAGQRVVLKPGGLHVMLTNLNTSLSAGQTVALTLNFESSDGHKEAVVVHAAVRPLNSPAQAPGHGAHRTHHKH